MARPLVVSPDLTIPAEELEFTFVRSSGPGGQNVNKVNTKAVLRFGVDKSTSLSPELKETLRARLRGRLNNQGELIIRSDRFRERRRNVVDCHNKLRRLLLSALAVKKPRIATKPSRASIERRLANKKHHSERKKSRGYRSTDPD